MDFSNILSWLQSLMASKQAQQGQQFGQNVGLQQQQLTNQNNQFGQDLGLRSRALDVSNDQFLKDLGLRTSTESAKEALANKEFGLSKEAQDFQKKIAFQNLMDNWAQSVQSKVSASPDQYGLNWMPKSTSGNPYVLNPSNLSRF